MRKLASMALILSTLILGTACEKTNTKKTSVEDLLKDKRTTPTTVTKKGFRCDITGENEQKEIFLQVQKKDGKTVVSFHDFITASKISLVGANFEGLNLFSLNLNEETKLVHADQKSLSDAGKVLDVTGRLSFDEYGTGLLEQKLRVILEDHSVKTTDFTEVGRIENCQTFEADWV